MANTEYSKILDVNDKNLFSVITDYEKYPEFLREIKSIKILKSNKNIKLVEYEIDVIKKIHYTLEIKEEPHVSVSWKLIEGDLFKINNGGWKLKKIGLSKVEVIYHLEIGFGMFVPKMITNQLASSSLPQMVSNFEKRTKEVFND